MLKDPSLNWNNDIDLGGKVAQLLSNITLIPGKGVFKNGSLVGNDTKIKGVGILFENVKIHGSWIAKEVSTRMFENLEYEKFFCRCFGTVELGHIQQCVYWTWRIFCFG